MTIGKRVRRVSWKVRRDERGMWRGVVLVGEEPIVGQPFITRAEARKDAKSRAYGLHFR